MIAATNRADVLDPALTRPGRFDRQVDVSLPDVKGRAASILEVHAEKIKLSPDVRPGSRWLAGRRCSPGPTWPRSSTRPRSSRRWPNKDFVEMSDLEEARDKVRFGRAAEEPGKIEEQERVATAYHEAGHAVVQYHASRALDPVHKVTIIPRGQAMGATFSLPEKDRYGYGKKYLLATMRVLCGGRIAEQHVRRPDDISSRAHRSGHPDGHVSPPDT